MTERWMWLMMALAWVLVLEGVMPLLFPVRWKRTARAMSAWSTTRVRACALASMLAGNVMMVWVHHMTPPWI